MSHPTDNLVRQLFAADEERAVATKGDGNTLYGHLAVFNRWTEINSMWEGRFLERIAPGAFASTIEQRAGQIRVLYDHGHDPQIGNKPLGVPDVLKEDKRGAYYEVSLFRTDYVEQLKPAIEAGQMGASFRFRVRDEQWHDPTTATKSNPEKLPERTITQLDLFEFGPVTFPAYADASAGLRSGTDQFFDRLLNDPLFVARMAERLGGRVVEQIVEQAHATGADGPERVDEAQTGADGPDGFTQRIHLARARALAHIL